MKYEFLVCLGLFLIFLALTNSIIISNLDTLTASLSYLFTKEFFGISEIQYDGKNGFKFPHLQVYIVEECLRSDILLLIAFFSTIAFLFAQKDLSLKSLIAIFIIASLATFFLNILRISLTLAAYSLIQGRIETHLIIKNIISSFVWAGQIVSFLFLGKKIK